MSIPTGQTIALLIEQLAAAEIPDMVERVSMFAYADGGFYISATVRVNGGPEGNALCSVNRATANVTPAEALHKAIEGARADMDRKSDANARAAAEFGAYMPKVRA